jgi:murein DD-endopeptidase MepM/ murein hydrolase activator NlpD
MSSRSQVQLRAGGLMMCGSRGSAIWPRVVAIALMGLGAAGCSDSGRFSDFSSNSAPRGEVAGSIPQGGSRVDSQPLPRLADNSGAGISGGGRGMGSYQPANGDVTGSLAAAPPPATFTWEGGTAITVRPGETLETISRRYGVPVAAIMAANSMTSPAGLHPGQHLVIPHRRGPASALASSQTRIPSTAPAGRPVGPAQTALAPAAGIHIVAPGETLHGIARLYGKPVMMLAKANNIPPDTMVKVGDRIVVPGVSSASASAGAPPPTAASPAGRGQGLIGSGSVGSIATADSPHSARLASPAPVEQQSAVKTAEPAGSLPSFRWPVRGRVIAGFGPSPNGLQNDGINLAVPEGTPVKAAEDGVIAYAGNELKGYGNLVLVRHGNGFVTAYAHASEILVKKGDAVKRGQVIAKSGQTGNVTSPQLHFEIRKGATPVDPSQYLNGA